MIKTGAWIVVALFLASLGYICYHGAGTLSPSLKLTVDISAPVGTKRILFHSPDISCGIIYAARVIAAQPQPLPPELVCCVC